ncbi:serine/threonine-protein kinase Wnk-like [Mytilus trossulus]|uniref:serine/threonine-protein kinase Wnk-like n=1 Tax=Mytilus trossulus TaxID=6551 RepID=UPI003006638D
MSVKFKRKLGAVCLLLALIIQNEGTTIPSTVSLEKEKAVSFLNSNSKETKQSVQEMCDDDYSFCWNNQGTCLYEDAFEYRCDKCSIFQSCYADYSTGNFHGNTNNCNDWAPSFCHNVPSFKQGKGSFVILMVQTFIILLLIITIVIVCVKCRKIKRQKISDINENDADTKDNDTKLSKETKRGEGQVYYDASNDRTDIKRQPEAWKETVVVPDEDYPIPAHNIKRNQVAPGRTKTYNYMDDNFEDQQSVPPVSTEYRQTGNRRYVKTPRYGRNGEQRTHYHDSGNAIEVHQNVRASDQPIMVQETHNTVSNIPQQNQVAYQQRQPVQTVVSNSYNQPQQNIQQQAAPLQIVQQPTMIQAQPNLQQNMPQQFLTTNQQPATNFQQQQNVPQLQQQPTMMAVQLPQITNQYLPSVQPQPVIGNVTTQQQQQDYSSGFVANNPVLQPQGGIQNGVQNTEFQ